MYYVYLLLSKIYNQVYIGSTNNLQRRLGEHNRGLDFFTCRYRPRQLYYYEAYTSERTARLREARLKHHGNAIKELKKRIGLPNRASRVGRKSGAGFTLAEILVVVSLFTVAVLVITSVYFSNNQFYNQENVKTILQNSSREAADKIMEFGRLAVTFVNTYTIGSTVYTADSELVIFRIPSIDGSNNIIAGTYDYAVIGKNPSNPLRFELIVDANPASSRKSRSLLFSDKLLSLVFAYDNPDFSLARKMDYNFSLQQIGKTTVTQTMAGSVTLRNK